MAERSSVQRLLDRAMWHWDQCRRADAAQPGPEPPPRRLTVCIEREAGISGAAIASEVGQRLGWHVYDHELLEMMAQEMHLHAKLLESVDERHESWLQESLESFSQVPTVGESAYVQHLIRTVLALGTHGESVILGRGSGFILPAETTFRLRLIAPERERVQAAMRKLGIGREQAARRVRAVDRQRRIFVRDHFLKDPRDPHNYDLVLNTSRYSIAGCADVIVDAVRRMRDAAAGPSGSSCS
jgi:cytidylate kinase